MECAGVREEVVAWLLCVDTRLEGVSDEGDRFLGARDGVARCDFELPFDEVKTSDHLGDGVFDLQTGVPMHRYNRLVTEMN